MRTLLLRWGAGALAFISLASGARTIEPTDDLQATKDVPVTCLNLDGASVFSQEPVPQFLGFFGAPSALNSIDNPAGPYGSTTSALSVRNSMGTYGSSTGIYSANSAGATAPPIIIRYGLTIGFLTTNSGYASATYPNERENTQLATIDANCAFVESAPSQYFTDQTGEGGLDVSFSGFWWNPSRSGEGLMVDFAELNGEPYLFIAFFTYDLNGRPLYLAGSVAYPRNYTGPLTMAVVSTEGARFGANFNPADVQRPQWGNITITVNSCNGVTMGYASTVPGYGSGTIGMVRFLQRDPFTLCP